MDSIKGALSNSLQATAWTDFVDDLKDKAEIERNPMPENAPYNVDMSLAETAGTEGSETPPTDGSSGAENPETPADESSETPAAEAPAE
jgi:foldase protein PrsA